MSIVFACVFFIAGWFACSLYVHFENKSEKEVVSEVKSELVSAESAAKTEVASLQPKSPTQAN